MSGRGRGRGRGGGSGPRSISQQYLQNSAQAAGIDVKQVNNMIGGGSNHKIFGDLELHSSGERRLHSHESDFLNDSSIVGGGKSSMSTVDGGEVAVKSEPPGTSSSSLIRDDNAEAANSVKPNSPKTVYLISKSREMHHKFQNSIFYIRGSSNTKDVVRYSDRKCHPTPSSESTKDAVGDILSHCLGGKKRTLGDGGGIFIPEELCGGQKQQKRRIVASSDGGGEESDKKKTNLAELAAKEGGDGNNNGDEQKQPSSNTATGGIIDEDEGEEVIQHQYEDNEDESDGADYVQNYYESEDDNASAGDGDGEPTF